MISMNTFFTQFFKQGGDTAKFELGATGHPTSGYYIVKKVP